jgi:hypothetical protein
MVIWSAAALGCVADLKVLELARPNRCWEAKTQSQGLKAKSQEPPFFSHSRDLSNGDVLRRNASLSDTLQSTRGRGSWDPNDRPQSTEVQAFPGLPADAALGPTM